MSGHGPTLTSHAHLTRQLTLIPVENLAIPVNIVGCGAIGSFAALALVKMGITNVQVWDHDEVSVENMSNQFYRFKDIGKNKASALRELIYDFTGVEITAHPRKFDMAKDAGLQGICVVAVDSMTAREEIYTGLLIGSKGLQLLIDPRMGAEVYMQFTLPLKADWYKNCLYSDKDAVQETCTAKSTVYTATLAAGMITKTVKNYIMGQPYPKSVSWNIRSSARGAVTMWPNTEEREEQSKGEKGEKGKCN